MPTNRIQIGPFAAFYIGDYGGSDVLTQILPLNTGPITVVDDVPEQYEPVVDNSVQSGLRKVTINLSFYTDDQIIINLARGLLVGETDKSVGSPFAQYVLLMAYPDETAYSSVLLQKCYTVKHLSANYEKTAPTKIDLQFVATNRNRFNSLINIDTLDNIATILGSRSPV